MHAAHFSQEAELLSIWTMGQFEAVKRVGTWYTAHCMSWVHANAMTVSGAAADHEGDA